MTKPTVAILGASRSRAKFGNKAVRAHVAQGFEVYPVNPHASSVEGLTAYPTLADVPVDRLDRVSVYLPPELGDELLEDIAACDPGEVWFNPGSESPELLARAAALGLEPIVACSIVNVGRSPAEFD